MSGWLGDDETTEAALWQACVDERDHTFTVRDGVLWCLMCGESDPSVPCRGPWSALRGIADVKPSLYERVETWYWRWITRPIARSFDFVRRAVYVTAYRPALDALDGWTMRQHSAVERVPGEFEGLACRLDHLHWPCAAWNDAAARRTARRRS